MDKQFNDFENHLIDKIITLALEEDLGTEYITNKEVVPGISGDITTHSIIDADKRAKAKMLFKEDGILAGMFLIERILKRLTDDFAVNIFHNDGEYLNGGEVIAEIEGNARAILMGERTILNFIQRLSGIATYTSHFLRNVLEIPNVKIIDTRKTTPGLRVLEKYAVIVGGAYNHRMGLYDMVLIKDNHIVVAGSISEAVNKVKDFLNGKKIPIEVETKTKDEAIEALENKVDRIMLDNMDTILMREIVKEVNKSIPLEASGGIKQHTVKLVAETGVDYISIGALTHSAKSIDISLKIDI